MTAGVLFKRHEDFMGFRSDHRGRGRKMATESILRNPNVDRTYSLGDFEFEGVFMDLHVAQADVGHSKIPAGDWFGIAVDPRQSFAIIFYDLANSENENRVTSKLKALLDHEFMSIRELERQASLSAEMVPSSQFRTAF